MKTPWIMVDNPDMFKAMPIDTRFKILKEEKKLFDLCKGTKERLDMDGIPLSGRCIHISKLEFPMVLRYLSFQYGFSLNESAFIVNIFGINVFLQVATEDVTKES